MSATAAAALAADIAAASGPGAQRRIVALAGPPGAGKSTFAEALVEALEALLPGLSVLVPMDGYHFDNAVLGPGLLARKGAPETFDVAGLHEALRRIRADSGTVAVPVFDRDLDLARAGARLVLPRHRVVLVEGNYLLLDEAPWDGLGIFFDETVLLDVPEAELRQRLVARWLHHGLGAEAAKARAEENDLVNARRVIAGSRHPDRVVSTAV